MNLIISKDLRRLAQSAADEFVRIANESIAARGVFHVALSGGSNPKALYANLVKAKVDWGRVCFYFSDERNVPPDDEQSNFRLANEHLFRPLSIGPDRIFRWNTGAGGPDEVAEEYSSRIRMAFLKDVDPAEPRTFGDPAAIHNGIRFDLILLGLGADGHTASLFPGSIALQFTGEITVAAWVQQLQQWRFTFTFTTINNARNVMFLASGAEKAQALGAVLEGGRDPELFPAQSVKPVDGELFWFVDRAAAAELSG